MTSLASSTGARTPLRLNPRWRTPCMDNLEQLDWVDAFAVTGFGARIGVRVSDPALVPDLIQRLPPGARLSTPGLVDSIVSVRLGGAGARRGVRNFHMVYGDHARIVRTHRLAAALDSFETTLRLAVALHSRRRVFVHAGAVAWRGAAILLPGATMAGKTELTAALVRAGAEYLSDEYALLDDAGRAHPFPKPLSLRDADFNQTETPVAEIGGRAARGAWPVGLVVMTRYRPGATWRPRRLSPGAGALAMLEHTLAVRRRPEQATCALAAAAARAPVFKTERADAAAAAQAILALAETLAASTQKVTEFR
jgi:hypothetical protein